MRSCVYTYNYIHIQTYRQTYRHTDRKTDKIHYDKEDIQTYRHKLWQEKHKQVIDVQT